MLKPGRDPRDKFVVPKFRDDVKEIADLKEGMELEGTVTNVTNFGAFVDLGVHQDGLVHISELSHKYVQDARQAVKVGDIVKVKVIGVDSAMKRISLSMKAIMPKPLRHPRRKKARPMCRSCASRGADGLRCGCPVAGPIQAKVPRPQRPARKPAGGQLAGAFSKAFRRNPAVRTPAKAVHGGKDPAAPGKVRPRPIDKKGTGHFFGTMCIVW